jgi:hypothetical protein
MALVLTNTQKTAFLGLEAIIENVFMNGVVDGSGNVLLPPMTGYDKLSATDKLTTKDAIKQILVPLLVTLLP